MGEARMHRMPVAGVQLFGAVAGDAAEANRRMQGGWGAPELHASRGEACNAQLRTCRLIYSEYALPCASRWACGEGREFGRSL